MKRVLWHGEARADITSIFDHFRAKDARIATLLVERSMVYRNAAKGAP